MPATNSIKILFVINPNSGDNKVDWTQVIRDYFQEEADSIELYLLKGKNDSVAIKSLIEKLSPTTVVAVGGDGTISLVAKLILHSGIALGILPAGSANGMATELGIPETPVPALDIIRGGKIKDADVIRINHKLICLHLSDIGLNARLIKNFDSGKRRGKWGYASVVLKTLWKRSHMKVHIMIDGEENVHAAEMVVLANASRYGTGALINPEGNLYDGRFEVVIMRKLAISELFKMWVRVRPFDPKKMKVFHATSVTINTRHRVHFQVDGEYLGKLDNIEAEILPGQLKLIVP